MKILENLLELKAFSYKFIDPPDLQLLFSNLFSSESDFLERLKSSEFLLMNSHNYSSIIRLLNKIDQKFQENLNNFQLEILLEASLILMRRAFVQTVYNSFDNLLVILRRNDDIVIIRKTLEIIGIYMTDEGRSLIEENIPNLRFLEEIFFLTMFISLPRLDLLKLEDFFSISYENLDRKRILQEFPQEKLGLNAEENKGNQNQDMSSYSFIIKFFDEKMPKFSKNSPLFDYFLIKEKIRRHGSSKGLYLLKLEAFKTRFLLFRFLKKENSFILSNELTENCAIFSFSLKEHVKNIYNNIIESRDFPNPELINPSMKMLRFFNDYLQNPCDDFKELAFFFERILEGLQEGKFFAFENSLDFINDFLIILKGKISFFLTSFQSLSSPSELAYPFSVYSRYFFVFMKSFNHFSYKIQAKTIKILDLMFNCPSLLEEGNLDSFLIEKANYYLESFNKPKASHFLEKSLINILNTLSNHFKEKQRNSLNQTKKKLKESEFFLLIDKTLRENQKNPFLNKIVIHFIRFLINYLDFDASIFSDLQETRLLENLLNINFCYSEEEPIDELYLALEMLKLMKFLIKFDSEAKLSQKRFEILQKTLVFFLRDELISPIYRECIHPKYEPNIKDLGKAFSREIIEILDTSNTHFEKEGFIAIIEKNLEIILNFQDELIEKLKEFDEEIKQRTIEQFFKLLLNFLMFLSRFFEIKWSYREKLFEVIYKKMFLLLKFPYLYNFDKIYKELLLKCYEPLLLLSREFIYDLSHYLTDIMDILKEQLEENKIQGQNNLKSKAFFINSLCNFIIIGFNENLLMQDGLEEIANEILDLYKAFLLNEQENENEDLLEFFIMVVKIRRMAYGQSLRKKQKNLRYYVKIMIEILGFFNKNMKDAKYLKMFNNLLKKIKEIFPKYGLPIEFISIFDELKGFEMLMNSLTYGMKNVENNEILELFFFSLNELFLLPISVEKQLDLKPIFNLYPFLFEGLSGLFFSLISNDHSTLIDSFLGKLLYKIMQSVKNFCFKKYERKDSQLLDEMAEINRKHLKLMDFSDQQINLAFLNVNVPKLENLLKIISPKIPENNEISTLANLPEYNTTTEIMERCCFDKLFLKEIKKKSTDILLLGLKNWKVFRSFKEKNLEDVLLTVLQYEEKEKNGFFKQMRDMMNENLKIHLFQSEYLLYHVNIISKVFYLCKVDKNEFFLECFDNPFFFMKELLLMNKELIKNEDSVESLKETLNQVFIFLNHIKDSTYMILIIRTLEFYNKMNIPITIFFLQNLLSLFLISIRATPQNIRQFLENDGLQFLKTLEISMKKKDKSIDGVCLEIFSEIMKIIICDIDFLSHSFSQDLMTYFENNEYVSLEKFSNDFFKYKDNSYFIKSTQTICFIHSDREKRYFINFKKKKMDLNYELSENIHYIIGFIIGSIITNLAHKIEVTKGERAFSFIFLIKTLHILIKSYPLIIPFMIDYNVTKFLEIHQLFYQKEKGGVSFKNITFLEFFCKEIVLYSYNNFNDFLIDLIRNSSTAIQRSKVIHLILFYLHQSFSIETPIDYSNCIQIHRLSCLLNLHLDLIKLKNINLHQFFLDFYIKILEDLPRNFTHKTFTKTFLSTLYEIISYLKKKPLVYFRDKGRDFRKEFEERFSKNAQKTVNNFSESVTNRNGVFEIHLEINEEIKDSSEDFSFFEVPNTKSFIENKEKVIFKLFNEENYPIYKDLSKKYVMNFVNVNKIRKNSSFSDFSFGKQQTESSSSFEENTCFQTFSHFSFYQSLLYSKAFSIDERISLSFINEVPQMKFWNEPHFLCRKSYKKKKTPSDDEIVAFLSPSQAFHQRLLERDQMEESPCGSLRNENIPEKYALEMIRDCGIIFEGNQKKDREDSESQNDNEEDSDSQDFLICNNESCIHICGVEGDEYPDADAVQKKKAMFKENILDLLLKKDNINSENKIQCWGDIAEKTEKKKKFWVEEMKDKKEFNMNGQIIRMVLNFLMEQDSFFSGLPIDFVAGFMLGNEKLVDEFIGSMKYLLSENLKEIENILEENYKEKTEKVMILEFYMKNKKSIKEKVLFLLTLLLEEQNYTQTSVLYFNLKQTQNVLNLLPLLLSGSNPNEIPLEDILISLMQCLIRQFVAKEETIDICLDNDVIDFLILKLSEGNEKVKTILTLFCDNTPKNKELVLFKLEEFLSSKIAEVSILFNKLLYDNISVINFQTIELLKENSLKISIAIDFLNQRSKIQSLFKNYVKFWRSMGDLLSFLEINYSFFNPEIQALLPLFDTILISYTNVHTQEILEKENKNEIADDFFQDEFEEVEKKNNDVFYYIFSKNKKLLNFILHREKSLLDSKILMTLLKFYPSLVDFEIKRQYFNEKLKKHKSSLNANSSISLSIPFFNFLK